MSKSSIIAQCEVFIKHVVKLEYQDERGETLRSQLQFAHDSGVPAEKLPELFDPPVWPEDFDRVAREFWKMHGQRIHESEVCGGWIHFSVQFVLNWNLLYGCRFTKYELDVLFATDRAFMKAVNETKAEHARQSKGSEE